MKDKYPGLDKLFNLELINDQNIEGLVTLIATMLHEIDELRKEISISTRSTEIKNK